MACTYNTQILYERNRNEQMVQIYVKYNTKSQHNRMHNQMEFQRTIQMQKMLTGTGTACKVHCTGCERKLPPFSILLLLLSEEGAPNLTTGQIRCHFQFLLTPKNELLSQECFLKSKKLRKVIFIDNDSKWLQILGSKCGAKKWGFVPSDVKKGTEVQYFFTWQNVTHVTIMA